MNRIVATLAALLASVPAAHAQSVSLAASATNLTGGFVDYAFAFGLPGPVAWTGLSGALSIVSAPDALSEMLAVLTDVPDGSCPAPGATWDAARHPDARVIGLWIVKGSGAGQWTLPITLGLPASVPIAGCLMLELNGGSSSGKSAPVTLRSSLALTYAPLVAPAASDPQYVIGIGGEACFGAASARAARTNAGCAALNGPTRPSRPTVAYASVTHITAPLAVLGAFGSVSSAAFAGKPQLDPPNGGWSTFADTFVLRGAECNAFPAEDGFYGPADYYSRVPRSAADIIPMELNGTARTTAQRQIALAYSGLQLQPGDCIVTVLAANASGGIDMEHQGLLLVQNNPAPVSAPDWTAH